MPKKAGTESAELIPKDVEAKIREAHTAILQQNKVTGFDPVLYLTRNVNTNGEIAWALDTQLQIRWFRLKYPNGKIDRRWVFVNDKQAICSAYVYLDKEDTNFVSNGSAGRFADFAPDNEFGLKYVESAETAAVGRALYAAGFGILYIEQSASLPEPNAINFNAPVQQQTQQAAQMPPTQPAQASDEYPAWMNGPAPEAPQPEQTQPPISAGQQAGMDMSAPQPDTAPQTTQPPSTVSLEPAVPADTPVEQLVQTMTPQQAASITATGGYCKGMTLGEIDRQCPEQLYFYAATDGVPPMLRAGAQVLLNRKQTEQIPQAS